MTKFYDRIVNHQKTIIAVFLVLFAVCLVCKQFVRVNYDMNDYLPQESPSTQALNLMEQEYDGGIPNARVMVKDVTAAQALNYKEKLLSVDGVTDVTWLDDAASVTVPLETLDPDTVETYYKDGNALFSVTIDEDKRIEAVEAIREIIKVDELVSAIGSIDSGASEINAGTKTLSGATGTLNDKVGKLYSGVGSLTNGAGELYSGLSDITAKNNQLTEAAYSAYEGLCSAAAAALNSQLKEQGLLDYTGAVSSAASGAKTLKLNMDTLYANTGTLRVSVGELNDAVRKLYGGTRKLADGTAEFVGKTADMDKQISDEIDSMTSAITGEDAETVSFVSENNTNVKSVQFVIKTAAIEKAAATADTTTEEAPLTFWQKLLRLFGLY